MYYILKKGKPDGHGAIRSISHFSPAGFRGWFRFYPSRFAAFGGIKIIYNLI